MNNRNYIIAGAIAGFLLIIYVFFVPGKLERQTSGLAVETVNAIAETWNAEELKNRSDPGLIRSMTSQGQTPEDLMKIYAALGKLKSPMKCKDIRTGSFLKEQTQFVAITYDCSGDFEHASAVIELTFSRPESGDDWKIYYLNVHSDIFGGEVIE